VPHGSRVLSKKESNFSEADIDPRNDPARGEASSVTSTLGISFLAPDICCWEPPISCSLRNAASA
jgi:hypothetical protein